VEALTKQNGVRLLGKLKKKLKKKKLKPTYPTQVFIRRNRKPTYFFWPNCNSRSMDIQLFQLRLSPEQSGKVEYERERLLGIANK
jgi:hypothetical protein